MYLLRLLQEPSDSVLKKEQELAPEIRLEELTIVVEKEKRKISLYEKL